MYIIQVSKPRVASPGYPRYVCLVVQYESKIKICRDIIDTMKKNMSKNLPWLMSQTPDSFLFTKECQVLLQESFEVSNPGSSILGPLLRSFSECREHEFTLAFLNVEDALLDTILNDQSPHSRLTLLSESIDTVESLVLDGGRPPAICQDGLIGGNEVETDAADAETGKENGAGGLVGEHVDGVVALHGLHLAVDADKLDAAFLEVGLHKIEERGPLTEYHGLRT